MDESATQEDMEEKREMARRLLEGDDVDKDDAKAVSLLEDCVAHGDADAMVMLAKCCALGRGMEHNAERAEALVSEAAEKGNHEARILLQPINRWKRKKRMLWWSLYLFLMDLKEKTHVGVISALCVEEDCTVVPVAFVMNIVQWRNLDLKCWTREKTTTCEFRLWIWVFFLN